MTKNTKMLARIICAFALFAAAIVVFNFTPLKSYAEYGESWRVGDYRFYVYALPYLAAFFIVGYDVIVKSVKNIFGGQVLDENFLMTVASIGAIALGDFEEAVAVMLFYQVGELFQSYAVGKSRRSIAALMDIRPDTACVLRDGAELTVSPDEVAVGETVVVRAGERIPVDGRVAFGHGSLDTSSLTGESLPRDFKEGDEVLSGSINLSGVIHIRAEKEFYDSTVSRILDLVENAQASKAKAENFITKFARFYTPIVVGAALIIGIIPPLFTREWAVWISRALTFLVVSCPCALVISVPLSFFGGIGGASKHGILVKGGGCMEQLAKAKIFVFDKTGTITKGEFEVAGVYPEENRDEILRLAAIAESGSLHPIAQSICRAAPKVTAEGYTIEEIAGYGVKATCEGEEIICASAKFLREAGIAFDEREIAGSAVYLAKNGIYVGCIAIEDAVKEGAKDAITELKNSGCRTVMLTGDNAAAAKKVAEKVGVDEYAAGLLPQDKVERVTAIIKEKKAGETLCFIGDGINDAPVLAAADVGFSMGGIGSDAAIEASDVVLMNDDLRAIPKARRISVRTIGIARQNIIFALGVKVAVLILSALGITGMWLAVFADVGVAVLAILNATRTLNVR